MPTVGGRPGANAARRAATSRARGVAVATPGRCPDVALLTLPGVFKPRSDSLLLADAVASDPATAGGAVCDVCTGSGVIALAAAHAGAQDVVAIDVSRRAVATVGLNARREGVRVRAVRGHLLSAVPGETFDVIASNPPYVPASDVPSWGARRAWDAGPDGRVLLDRLLAEAPGRLRPGGALLVTHSDLIGEEATVRAMEAAGLEVDVPVREHGPLGPLMREKVEQGLVPDADEEQVLVIRGRRPAA